MSTIQHGRDCVVNVKIHEQKYVQIHENLKKKQDFYAEINE